MTRSRSITLKVGEQMRVGDAVVTLLEKSGQQAKLRVVADEHVSVEHPLPVKYSMAHEGVTPLAPTART